MVQYRSISTPVLPRHAHSEEHGRRNVERRPSSRKGSPTQNLRAGQNGTKEPSRFGITVGMIKLLMTTRGGTEKTSLKRVKGEGSAEECTIQSMMEHFLSASSGPKWAFKISSPQTYFGCYFKVRNLESLSASRAILSRLEHSLRTSWCKKNLACLNFQPPSLPLELLMHSPSALTEHVSLNLARFFFARTYIHQLNSIDGNMYQ